MHASQPIAGEHIVIHSFFLYAHLTTTQVIAEAKRGSREHVLVVCLAMAGTSTKLRIAALKAVLPFVAQKQLIGDDTITDCFVIATPDTERGVHAIVDEVEEKLREAGHKPVRREGVRDGRWALLDYLDVVVHIQHVDEREFYALERLWKDCPVIEVPGIGAADSGERR